MKKYVRSPARMIGFIGQPLLYLLALGYGFKPVFEKAGGGDYIAFLVPGIVAMTILFTAMFAAIEIIWDRQFGFLKETLVAPVSRFSIMAGRTLGGATVALAQGALVVVLALIIGFRPEWHMAMLWAIPVAFLIALMFTAIGTILASLLTDMQAFPIIMNFLIMPIFFLSGALFPLTGLSKTMEIITRIDPLTYGVDGLRLAFLQVTQFSLGLDILVLALVTGVALAWGSYLFSRIQV